MPFYRRDDWLQNALGQALAGGKIYYCSQPANTGTIPPSPLVSVYSDSAGTPASNPQTTDGFGHSVAYLAPGTYTIVYTHPQMGTIVLTDQQVVASSGQSIPSLVSEQPAGSFPGNTFSLTYTPLFMVGVFYNGLLLRPGADYSITGTTITLSFQAVVNDTVASIYFINS